MAETTTNIPDEAVPDAAGPQSGALPALTIDWDLFGGYLEDSEMSDAEKQELIFAVWSIVVSFVDLGLGIHPTQLATRRSDASDDVNGHAAEEPAAIVYTDQEGSRP